MFDPRKGVMGGEGVWLLSSLFWLGVSHFYSIPVNALRRERVGKEARSEVGKVP